MLNINGKPCKLYSDNTVSGSWTALTTRRELTNVDVAVSITGLLWASGSYTTDLVTPSGSATKEHAPAFKEPAQAISGSYRTPVAGSYVQFKDNDGDVFYGVYAASEGDSHMSFFDTPISVRLPVSYFDSDGENMIRILGTYQ